jgi:hypothetical protein
MTKRAPNDASLDDPTDLELMLHADGELEGERLAAVQAWLDAGTPAGRAGQRKIAALHLGAGIVREHVLATAAGADGIADAVMDAIEREKAPRAARPPEREKPAANDNARGFYLVAAVLVAAAAAVLLWGRPPAAPGGGRGDRLASGSVSQPSARELGGDPTVPDTSSQDVEHGVEVLAVDFGSRTGAVLYVPGETPGSSTTTVVWLSDDDVTGEEDE